MKTYAWISGIPALLSIVVYANTLGNGFAGDDMWTLNTLADFELSLRNFFQMRGLTWTLHKLDVALWGDWASGYHVTNVLLHSLASALTAAAAFKVSRSGRIGLLCGVFFAVHPVHAESVASFAYRKDILAMIFVSLALLIWVTSRRPVVRYPGTLACYGLAFLSKEVAALALPVLLFLADLLPGKDRHAEIRARFRTAARRFAPILATGVFVAVLSVFGLTSSFFQGSRPWVPAYVTEGPASSSFAADISEHFSPEFIHRFTEEQCRDYGDVLANVAAAIPDHARLLFFPLKLSADYPVKADVSLSAPVAAAGVIFLAAWILTGLLLLKREPVASFAIAWSVIMFIPCSNVFPLVHFFVVERFLYVPSFGACLLLAVAFDRALAFAGRRNLGWLRVGILVLTLFVVTAAGARAVIRNRDWKDEYSLWSSAIRDGCGTIRAHSYLGTALFQRGRFEEAIEHYKEALKIKPEYADASANLSKAHYNLGKSRHAQKRLDEAVEHYTEALLLDSGHVRAMEDLEIALTELGKSAAEEGQKAAGDAKAHNTLGIALAKCGKLDNAVEHFSEAVGIDPGYAEAYYNLGFTFAKQMKYDEAVAYYNEALRLDPDYAESCNNLGVILAKRGDLDEAVSYYREALRLKPDYAMAHSNLASALAKQGKFAEAVEQYTMSLKSDPGNAMTHLNLGIALEAQGELEEAERSYSEALRLDPDFAGAGYCRERLRELQPPR